MRLRSALIFVLVGPASAGRRCSVKRDPPPSLFCGKTGVDHGFPDYRPWNVSFDECVMLMDRSFFGNGFSYDRQSATCKFYSASRLYAVFQPSDTGVELWDGACFDCRDDCPDPSSRNLLTNSNLTSSVGPIIPLLWMNPQHGEDWMESVVLGKPGIQCDGRENNRRERWCELDSPNLNWCRGQMYILALSYHVLGNVKGHLCTGMRVASSRGDFCASAARATSKTSGDIYLSVQTHHQREEGGSMQISFSDHYFNSLTAVVDGVKIMPQPLHVPTKSGSPSLVKNGNFEHGRLEPWSVNDMEGKSKAIWGITSPGYESKYAFTFSKPSNSTGFVSLSLTNPRMSTIPGRTYVLSFNFYGDPSKLSTQISITPSHPPWYPPSLWDPLGLWKPSSRIHHATSETMFREIEGSRGWFRFERIITVEKHEKIDLKIFLEYLKRAPAGERAVVDNVTLIEADLEALEAGWRGAAVTEPGSRKRSPHHEAQNYEL